MKKTLYIFLLFALLTDFKAENNNAKQDSNPIYIEFKAPWKLKKVLNYSGFLAFSPDSRLLAIAHDNVITLWDVLTETEIRTLGGLKNPIICFALSFNGKIISAISARETVVKIWDVSTGIATRTLSLPQSQYPVSLAISPNGKIIAALIEDFSLFNNKGTIIKLWDVSTGREIRELSVPMSTNGLTFSPDGKALVTRGTGTINFLDFLTGRVIKTFSHSGYVTSLTFSQDGKFLASGAITAISIATMDVSIKLWNVSTGEEIWTLPVAQFASALPAFSPDGRFIANESFEGRIKIYDISTGLELWELKQEEDVFTHIYNFYSLTFSPDGKFLAASGKGGGYSKIWKRSIPQELEDLLYNISMLEIEKNLKIKDIESKYYKPKDQFETTNEYETRVSNGKKLESQIKEEYNQKINEIVNKISNMTFQYETDIITIENYDADKGGFNAIIEGNKTFIPVEREIAKEIWKMKDNLLVKGLIRLADFDNKKFEFFNTYLSVKGSNIQIPFGEQRMKK